MLRTWCTLGTEGGRGGGGAGGGTIPPPPAGRARGGGAWAGTGTIPGGVVPGDDDDDAAEEAEAVQQRPQPRDGRNRSDGDKDANIAGGTASQAARCDCRLRAAHIASSKAAAEVYLKVVRLVHGMGPPVSHFNTFPTLHYACAVAPSARPSAAAGTCPAQKGLPTPKGIPWPSASVPPVQWREAPGISLRYPARYRMLPAGLL